MRRQARGLPMGGKASAELANLYCYTIESQFIDSLIQQGKTDEAKSWYHTWRYIEDLLGFGDREKAFSQIDCRMEHLETTFTKCTAPKRPSSFSKGQAVFLGMRIFTNPEGVFTSAQPTGDGWMWLPRKFIYYSSFQTQ